MLKPISRIYGLDLARSIAIFLATISHTMLAFHTSADLHADALQLLFRAAPPTFIIVFGVFVELIYYTDYVNKGPRVAAKRLLSRAIQCYVLYAASCLILAVAQHYSVKYFLRMILLMGATPYTDILKFYAAMLLLAPLLLAIRHKRGLRPLMFFCLAVHIVHTIFYPLPYYEACRGCDVLFGFLYGATTVIAGPSILHGITFVVVGMWLGDYIRNHMERHRVLDVKSPVVLYALLACVAWLAVIAGAYGPGFINDMSSLKFRNSNSYIYFLFGIAAAIITIDACLRFAALTGDRIKPWLFLGATSLFTFSIGNSVLYVIMDGNLPTPQAIISTFAAGAFIISLSWGFNRLRIHIIKTEVKPDWQRWYLFLTKGYADRLAMKLLPKQ